MTFQMRLPVSFLILSSLVALGIWGLQSLIAAKNFDVSEPLVRVPELLPPQVNRCAACHQEVYDDFATAPHSRTLVEACDRQILARFAGRSFQLAAGGPTVSFLEREKQLWMKSDSYPDSIRIDWMFGSGQHAMTPVSLLSNPDGSTELIEGSVSWFPSGVLGATPGADVTGSPGISSLGNHLDHATTLECFGCHVTHLPHDRGRLKPDAIFKGVSCDRCHPGGEQHIQAIEQGNQRSIEKWSELSPLESINRCGECHRRADQLTSAELSPERPVLVRFASVGIAMSACFQQQDDLKATGHTYRMDCLTCHDPHQPAEKSPKYYTDKCFHCHGPAKYQASECTSKLTSNACLSCHMPAVNATENLRFTDHWIRVRQTSDPPAAH